VAVSSISSTAAEIFIKFDEKKMAYRRGGEGFKLPPEIPKALQNLAKLKPT